jgi:hypothetical protein
MIHIRLYRAGGRYVDSANKKILLEKRKKEKKKKRKKEKKRKEKKRKGEATCTIADEQPSTLGIPDFRKSLGCRSP